MELKKLKRGRSSKKLRTIFIGYLLIFCVATFLLVTLLVASYEILSSNGTILPGYFSKKQLLKMKDTIASSETVTAELIPETCNYAVFTPEGKFLSGNLSATDATQAWKSTQAKDSRTYSVYHYFLIPHLSKKVPTKWNNISKLL